MRFVFSLLAIAGCAGCATPETIPLSDEAQIARLRQAAAPLPAPVAPALKREEIQQVEREIFVWLLQRPLGDDQDYSAVFLQADERMTAGLMKQFPAHIPPIKQLWHLQTRLNQSPLDKDTGQPAVILSADVLDPEEGVVQAVGKWFGGAAAAGFHTFELRQHDGDWRIESVK